MNAFWQDHWWLLIPLGAFTIPLAGIALGAMATWQHFNTRNKVLETLKRYADQGREPPPELLRQLDDGDDKGAKWKWQDTTPPPGADYSGYSKYAGRWADPEAIRARTEYYTARAAARAERWRLREPIRRWNNAIFWTVLAGALYLASEHYASDRIMHDRLYIGALILGALAVAAVLAAVLSTLYRPR
jgi:hypothetical protein